GLTMPPRSPMKLLLLGDRAKCRRLLAFGLLPPEIPVTMVTTDAELVAVDGLASHTVALIDWEMSTQAAAELRETLRRLHPGLPVVVIAAPPVPAGLAHQAGAAAVFEKPVQVGSL